MPIECLFLKPIKRQKLTTAIYIYIYNTMWSIRSENLITINIHIWLTFVWYLSRYLVVQTNKQTNKSTNKCDLSNFPTCIHNNHMRDQIQQGIQHEKCEWNLIVTSRNVIENEGLEKKRIYFRTFCLEFDNISCFFAHNYTIATITTAK